MKVEILISNPSELRLFNDFASMLFTMRGQVEPAKQTKQQELDLEIKQAVREAESAVQAEEAIEKAAAKTKAKPKAEPKPPVVEAEPAPAVATREDAKKVVMQVSKEKGHDAALGLLAKFGAKKISEVAEEDIAALVEAGQAL